MNCRDGFSSRYENRKGIIYLRVLVSPKTQTLNIMGTHIIIESISARVNYKVFFSF